MAVTRNIGRAELRITIFRDRHKKEKSTEDSSDIAYTAACAGINRLFPVGETEIKMKRDKKRAGAT